jgi:hypothetical protein
MHELQLTFYTGLPNRFGPMPHLAALGVLRQLPALARLGLELNIYTPRDFPVQWPPFIPPSLKALRIVVIRSSRDSSILRALPGMLEASKARLDRLEIDLHPAFEAVGDGLVPLAQILRCCSPTLKGFHLSGCIRTRSDPQDYADQMERLREQWADVLAGVSACRELQVLVLPWIEVEPLFPPGTAFRRLTHLAMWDHEREHPPDAGVMGLWELMASGGLPALAKLKVKLEGRGGGMEKIRTQVVPGLEAVAGTLTHLNIGKTIEDKGPSDADLGYELGVAVGKLRRLKDLALGLFDDGRALHALAQGLAASGGDRPLPLLWRVHVIRPVEANADLLASLVLPSVGVFGTAIVNGRPACLTACALRLRGYRGIWAAFRYVSNASSGVRAAAQCSLLKRTLARAIGSSRSLIDPSRRSVVSDGGWAFPWLLSKSQALSDSKAAALMDGSSRPAVDKFRPAGLLRFDRQRPCFFYRMPPLSPLLTTPDPITTGGAEPCQQWSLVGVSGSSQVSRLLC